MLQRSKHDCMEKSTLNEKKPPNLRQVSSDLVQKLVNVNELNIANCFY